MNTNDGGSFLVGTALQNSVSRGLLIKLSPEGKVQWSRIIKANDSNSFYYMYAVIQLKDNTYAVSMTSGPPEGKKISVIKLNESGDRIWEKTLRNNYGTSIFEPAFYINNINEGKDGDLILNTYENGDHFLKNGYGITRLNSDGNVVWSLQYFDDKVQIDANSVNSFQNGRLTFWGKIYDKPYGTQCDGNRDFLNSITLNYNTADIEKVICYCISTENKNVCITPELQKNFLGSFVSIALSNTEYAVYIQENVAESKNLFIKFDSELKFRSAYRFVPFVKNLYYNFLPSDINENDGRFIMKITESSNKADEPVKPYNFQIHINEDSKIQKQIYFGNNRSQSFLHFQKDNRINEVENKNGSVTINNVSADPEASLFCQDAIDTAFGYIEDYKFIQTDVDYQWEDIRRNVYTAINSSDIIVEPVEVDQIQECKTVSYCDSLKLIGERDFCLKNDKSVLLNVKRNPECKRIIQWSFDTTYAGINKQVGDTSVELTFKKPKISPGILRKKVR